MLRAWFLASALLVAACGSESSDGPDAAPSENQCDEWRRRPEATQWNSCDADIDGDGTTDFGCLDVFVAPDGTFGCVELTPEGPGECIWVVCDKLNPV
jgi:hypothetical protein